MNLKQNIDNTNELKNKVKLANTRIKETIVRGGGYDFKSLDKAPERIKSMLGQYSKVAFGERNFNGNDLRKNTTIMTNLTFKPKRIVVTVVHRDSESVSGLEYGTADSKFNYSEYTANNKPGDLTKRTFWITNISKSSFTLNAQESYYDATVRWIAIG